MTPVLDFLLLLVCHLMLLLVAAGDGNGYRGECPASFECGYLGNISFPFTTTERPDCGLLSIQNCDEPLQVKRMIQLQNKGKWFYVILEHQNSPTSIQIRDNYLYKHLQSRSCEAFRYNYTPPPTFHFSAFSTEFYTTIFRCNRTLHLSPPAYVVNYTRCPDYNLYYTPLTSSVSGKNLSSLAACTKVRLPIKDVPDAEDPFTFVNADITIQVHLSEECANCHYQKRGLCQLDSQSKFYCAKGKPQIFFAIMVVALICFLFDRLFDISF